MKTTATNAFGEAVHETAESHLLLNISIKDEEGKCLPHICSVFSRKPAHHTALCCDSIWRQLSMENVCGCGWAGEAATRSDEKGLRVICHLELFFAFPFCARTRWRRSRSYFHWQWMKEAECHPSSWQMRQDDLLYLLTVISALTICWPTCILIICHMVLLVYDVSFFFFFLDLPLVTVTYIRHRCEWCIETAESFVFEKSGWSYRVSRLQEENQSEAEGKAASTGMLAINPFTSFLKQPSFSLQTSDRSDYNWVSVHPPEPNYDWHQKPAKAGNLKTTRRCSHPAGNSSSLAGFLFHAIHIFNSEDILEILFGFVCKVLWALLKNQILILLMKVEAVSPAHE